MRTFDVVSALAAAPVLDLTTEVTRDEVVSTRRSFGQLDSYEIGGRRFKGTSPWELHPAEDELLYVIEGEMDVTLLMDDAQVTVTVTAGCLFVVPKGTWHRQYARDAVTSWGITATHSDQISFAADPRVRSDSC